MVISGVPPPPATSLQRWQFIIVTPALKQHGICCFTVLPKSRFFVMICDVFGSLSLWQCMCIVACNPRVWLHLHILWLIPCFPVHEDTRYYMYSVQYFIVPKLIWIELQQHQLFIHMINAYASSLCTYHLYPLLYQIVYIFVCCPLLSFPCCIKVFWQWNKTLPVLWYDVIKSC